MGEQWDGKPAACSFACGTCAVAICSAGVLALLLAVVAAQGARCDSRRTVRRSRVIRGGLERAASPCANRSRTSGWRESWRLARSLPRAACQARPPWPRPRASVALAPIISEAALATAVDPSLLMAVIDVESRGNPRALSQGRDGPDAADAGHRRGARRGRSIRCAAERDGRRPPPPCCSSASAACRWRWPPTTPEAGPWQGMADGFPVHRDAGLRADGDGALCVL